MGSTKRNIVMVERFDERFLIFEKAVEQSRAVSQGFGFGEAFLSEP